MISLQNKGNNNVVALIITYTVSVVPYYNYNIGKFKIFDCNY